MRLLEKRFFFAVLCRCFRSNLSIACPAGYGMVVGENVPV